MVMYLATNLGHSTKAVRRGSSPKKHYSHLDIYKTPAPPAIASFIKIPWQREEEEEEILEEEQAEMTWRKKRRSQVTELLTGVFVLVVTIQSP